MFESPRNLQSHIKQSASGSLGPGEYHNEGHLHKLAMEAVFPKKQVPFNSQAIRKIAEPDAKPMVNAKRNVSPGKLLKIDDFIGPG